MIAIILPTRGLVFTEVEQAIDDIQYHTGAIVLRSWNKPLPEAQNFLVEKALLLKDLTHLLFIEEDTIPPNDAIFDLIKADADIAFIDYGVNSWSCSAKRRNKDQEILWCGFGCTLVKNSVFEKVEKPWFRNDKTFRLNSKQWINTPYKYGGQDIWFCFQAKEKGCEIVQVEGECRHMQIQSLGKSGINSGLHNLIERPKIAKRQIIDI